MGKCGGRGLNSEGWTDRRPTSCALAVLKVCTEMGMWAKKTSASNSSSSRAPSSHITASDLFEPLTIVPLKMVLDRPEKQHAGTSGMQYVYVSPDSRSCLYTK